MNPHFHECPECRTEWEHEDEMCAPDGPEIWPSYGICPDCDHADSAGDALPEDEAA